MTSDPFGAEELRRRVLAAWRESPARFRADANLEDDLALVGYRDRVIVELAQNAADAATRAGAPGYLVLDLTGDVLTASNTGTPLDAAGVESISVARASAKLGQTGTVGRFGVGFAAVLAVSDEPSIVSSVGAVRWSRAQAETIVAGMPELAGELAARGGRVPVLRLPFAARAALAMDADTVVELPLRDPGAVAAVRAQLAALEPTLLLALAALGEVVVRIDGAERVLRAEHVGDTVTMTDGAESTRWSIARASGALATELLADRGAEEQHGNAWQVTWALPVDEHGRLIALPASVGKVVRAPTPVDDPLTLPAVLIASYPLDASRRRVTPGPLTDAITGHTADTLAAALATMAADPSFLRLVPTGFADGAVDGALHAAVLERLRETAWLPVAGEPDVRQRPRDAIVVADPLVEPLAAVVTVLPAGWSRPELVALEVRRPPLTELIDLVGGVDQDPSWWHLLYAALDAAVPAGPERDVLGALPVLLSDGSVVTGPRGVVLGTAELAGVELSVIGLRVVHPGAAHPLLRSLGAVEGTPRGLLDQPEVQAAVEASYDEDDPEPIAAAVLALLAASGAASDELPWLADLALPDDAGDWRPAGELLLPDGAMAKLVVEDSPFGRVSPDWVGLWGAATLTAVGVLDGPAMLRESDPIGPTHDLDDEAAWWATLPADASLEELVAVRDLEQVRPAMLADLLATLAQPPLRSAVVDPVLVIGGGGRQWRSYTAWWLSSRPVLDGQVPRELRLAGSDQTLAGLYAEAPATLDPEFLRALGVIGSLRDADPDDVLARLADADREVGRGQLRAIYAWLADQAVTPPARVRGVRAGQVVVVDAAEVVVLDAPDLAPLLGQLAVVPVAPALSMALADVLDVPLASERGQFAVVSTGEVTDDAVVHDPLRVVDVDGRQMRVAWRLVGDTLNVDCGQLAFGLGRGRAWRDRQWDQRHRRTEALIVPEAGMMLDAEDDLDNLS